MRPLHYVTGKGGVGKSTVVAGLAMAAAGRGARVLAVELGEPAGLERILAGSGIAVASYDGAAALAEYLGRRHLGRLGRAVLDHPLYRAFVAAAPGLRELMVIGKVRDELVLQRRWDVIVVDAGASGRALEHLRMPAAAARAFGAGLVHREAARNAALLADPRACAVHVVATGEAMPIGEAIQVIGELRGLGLPVGAALINLCRAPAPPGVDAALHAVRPPEVAAVLWRARRHERTQEAGITALEAETGVVAGRLPRIWVAEPAAVARALAPRLAEVLA